MVAVIGEFRTPPAFEGRQSDRAPAARSEPHSQSLQFVRDPASGRVAVKVVDEVTGEEIKSIPSEGMLRALAGIRAAIGLLLDQKG